MRIGTMASVFSFYWIGQILSTVKALHFPTPQAVEIRLAGDYSYRSGNKPFAEPFEVVVGIIRMGGS